MLRVPPSCPPELSLARPELPMVEFVVHVGRCSNQGVRARNEDRLFADEQQGVYLVADGMGGQLYGDLASTLASEVIPRVLHDRLAAHEEPRDAIQKAII